MLKEKGNKVDVDRQNAECTHRSCQHQRNKKFRYENNKRSKIGAISLMRFQCFSSFSLKKDNT